MPTARAISIHSELAEDLQVLLLAGLHTGIGSLAPPTPPLPALSISLCQPGQIQGLRASQVLHAARARGRRGGVQVSAVPY
jgi:hypothetical protein